MPKHTIEPEKWIDRYSDYLFNYTISRVNDREMAKDLVQDTFVASLKSMKNFKGEASERTWLISILKRKIQAQNKINARLISEVSHSIQVIAIFRIQHVLNLQTHIKMRVFELKSG